MSRVVITIRAEDPRPHGNACGDACPCSKLMCLMHDISERERCATWYIGIELILWKELHGKDTGYLNTFSNEVERKLMGIWADACGGWVSWPEEVDWGPIWVSAEEWSKAVTP